MSHGTCRFAAACRYAHGVQEMRQAAVRKPKAAPKSRRRAENKETKALAKQLESVRKQAQELQNQLQVLQSTVRGKNLALTVQNFPSPDQGGHRIGGADPGQQTHKSSASSSNQGFMDQESSEDDRPRVPPSSLVSGSPASELHHDEPFRSSAAGAAAAHSRSVSVETSDDDEWPSDSALVVKHTFIDVVSLHEPIHRRVASVPRNMRRSKGLLDE